MAEQRLIDANKAFETVTDLAGQADTKSAYAAFWKAGRAIQNMNTVDAVEVVRCKDCKFAYINSFSAKQEKALCNRHFNHDGNAVIMGADDFCSYGERKENG